MTSIINKLTAGYSRRRFACLFCSLVITMVAAPVFGAMGLSTRFMEAFVALNILAAVLITIFRFSNYAGLVFVAMVLAARTAHAFLDFKPLLATSQGAGAVVCIIAICAMLRFILSEGSVTSERIFAALDVYLLIGVMCGLLFCILEEQWPGSFSLQGSSLAGGKRDVLAHTVYFSFVTLGTLGYGDITPLGGPVRALAVAEAMIGQMYLVVVVARLVGLYKADTGRDDRRENRNEAPPSG
jgi:hypothetical protein